MNESAGYCEGDVCRRNGCAGVIQMRRAENCSCHLHAPCGSCTAPRCYCNTCEWDEADDQIVNDYVVNVDRKTGTYRYWEPRPLDRTKLDWRSHGHTHFSMIKEGCYPPGMGMAEVEKELRGTFGGRFESFAKGLFKYIAYTD